MHRIALAATVLVAALALPAAAQAVTIDRQLELSAAATEVAWEGTSAFGTYFYEGNTSPFDPAACSKDPDTYCDISLLHVVSGSSVTLSLTLGDYGFPASDFDLFLYRSDATGQNIGEEIDASGNAPSQAEELEVDPVAPGYYLVVVAYFLVPEGGYAGTASVSGATPVTQAPAGPGPSPGGEQPALTELPFKAASSTLGSARKAKKARSLRFRVTTERTIENLRVTLRKGSRSVGTATVASLPEGTRTLRLKVSRKIKKGSYTLAATGTVDGRELSTTQRVKLRK